MKSVISILLVAFVFGAVSLMAAQEPQTTAPPTVAPAVATANTVNSGMTTEPGATSSDRQVATTPPPASKSPAEGADSENKPVLDRLGNPDPAQNFIEYGGPG